VRSESPRQSRLIACDRGCRFPAASVCGRLAWLSRRRLGLALSNASVRRRGPARSFQNGSSSTLITAGVITSPVKAPSLRIVRRIKCTGCCRCTLTQNYDFACADVGEYAAVAGRWLQRLVRKELRSPLDFAVKCSSDSEPLISTSLTTSERPMWLALPGRRLALDVV